MDMEYSPKPHTTYPLLQYAVEGYTDEIVQDFEQRLDTIFGRQVNRVHVLDFARMTEEMRQTLVDRTRMVYTWDEGHELFTSHAWRRLFEIRGPLVREFILEFFSTSLGLHTAEEMAEDGFEAYWAYSLLWIYSRPCEEDVPQVDFLQHFWHAEGRKSGARMSEGYFIWRLAKHFGLVSDEGLMRLSVITRMLLRQSDDAAGALEGAEGDPDRIARLEEEVHELRESIVGLCGVVDRSITDQSRFATWMISCMTQLMDASARTYHAFDRTLVGSSQMPYQRRTKRRTGDANTPAAPQQSDP
ncbi:hypothetical protein Tco_0630155 [Tanacetum coccineum]